MINSYIGIASLVVLCVILSGCGKNERTLEGGERNCQITVLKNLYAIAEGQALARGLDVPTAFVNMEWDADDVKSIRDQLLFIDMHYAVRSSRGVIKIRKSNGPLALGNAESLAYVAKWYRIESGDRVLIGLSSDGSILHMKGEPPWASSDLDSILELQ